MRKYKGLKARFAYPRQSLAQIRKSGSTRGGFVHLRQELAQMNK
jgi:hypothetical protein